MKYGDVDQYISDFPKLRRWIRECSICHTKGYDPEMPDNVGGSLDPGFAARYIKGNLNPLVVDEMGFCQTCSKYIK